MTVRGREEFTVPRGDRDGCWQEPSRAVSVQEACQRWRLPLPTYREAQGSYQEFGCECLLATAEGAEPVVLYHRARTKKASKAGAAQAALDYLAEHRPELLEPPPTPVRGGGEGRRRGEVYVIVWPLYIHLPQAVDEDVMAGLGVWRKGEPIQHSHRHRQSCLPTTLWGSQLQL